jgi:hypothetical protein
MITSTTQKIATVLAALAVLAALTGVAQAATSKPAGMSKAEYRALVIRSDALNQKYGLGKWQGVPEGMTAAEYRALVIRSEALNQKYGLGKWQGVPEGMTPAEYRALMIRSEALNKQYSLGKWSTASTAQPPTGSTNHFAWGAFGIGAVAMLGLVLLASGVFVASRYSRGTPRVRTS